ncbi:MAG: hypothetical protein Q9222_002404 [Ikaeria aurantiellina]
MLPGRPLPSRSDTSRKSTVYYDQLDAVRKEQDHASAFSEEPASIEDRTSASVEEWAASKRVKDIGIEARRQAATVLKHLKRVDDISHLSFDELITCVNMSGCPFRDDEFQDKVTKIIKDQALLEDGISTITQFIDRDNTCVDDLAHRPKHRGEVVDISDRRERTLGPEGQGLRDGILYASTLAS